MSALSEASTRSGSGVSGRLAAFLFIVSLGIATIPIFSCEFPSINDYLNHLARAAVLLWYDDNPAFSSYFLPNWKPLPNLAFDVCIFGLGRIFPIAVAGKLFVVLTFALLLSGVIFLHRCTFKKWSLWPFLALLLLYNRLLLVGYLNFLFGVGLWLYALSFWVYFRSARAALRISVLSITALIIFFVHLAAFGLLAVTIVVYELAVFDSSAQQWQRKLGDLLLLAIPFLPPVLIAAFLSPHSSASAAIRYRDIATRIAGFAVPILYDWRIDGACYLLMLGLFLWTLVAKSVKFDGRLSACVFALFVLQFCMPNVIMTAEGGDRRVPLPMMLLAIGATDLRTDSRNQRLCFILATGAVFVFRIADVEARWLSDQPIYADVWRGISVLPAGARVASAFSPDSFDDFSVHAVAICFIPVWGIVSRGGFTQTLFAFSAQQPLVLTPRYEALAAAAPADSLWRAFVAGADTDERAPLNPGLVAALREYDFIVFVGRRDFAIRNTPLFRLLYDGQYVRIYSLDGGK